MEPPNHLIIVCGHAIWAGGPTNGQDESEWIIESWKKGETPTYTAHVKAGLKVLSDDDRSVLMFSGGPTVTSTPLSEARSYANLAAANSYWDLLQPSSASSSASSTPTNSSFTTPQPPHPLSPISLHPRILLEERALDSYQNILFSIIHFWRCHSHTQWPSRLTIVSHSFKRRRLTEAHCNAISFPLEKVTFVGINPPGVPEVVENEERAVDEWMQDPQGQSEGLRGKRSRRNCWGTVQTLFLGVEERHRSGIETKLLEGAEDEILVDGGLRPWGKEQD